MIVIRLKELRQEIKLNMRQTAIALKMPYTTYVSYEKGEREPNSEVLILLANFFGCSVDYLVGRSDDRAAKLSPPAETLLADIKKDLPRTAPQSERDRIVESIVTKLQKLSDDDIDDMYTIFDYLDFRRRRPE